MNVQMTLSDDCFYRDVSHAHRYRVLDFISGDVIFSADYPSVSKYNPPYLGLATLPVAVEHICLGMTAAQKDNDAPEGAAAETRISERFEN